jgi:monoamine oxidase
MSAAMRNEETFDCAIVGAGISGCYAAWRLAKAFPTRRIALIERGNRLGGRLLSRPICCDEGRIDFGAMRYRTTQVKTRMLIENILELSVRPLPLGKGNRLYFLRGMLLDDSAFLHDAGHGQPYRLPSEFRNLNPPKLLCAAIERVLLGLTGRSEQQGPRARMDGSEHYQGQPLVNWDFWNLMHSVLSTEGYYCALDAAGIGNGTVGRWNAAEAIAWFLDEFDPHTEYRLINGGFDSLTTRLADHFRAQRGQIFLNEEARMLDLPSGLHGPLRIGIRGSGLDRAIVAQRVVLAIPPVALRGLALGSTLLQPCAPLIASVTGQSLTRLVLRYAHRWWRTHHPDLSRLVTDLPIRQVTFGIEPPAHGGALTPEETFVLCSFNDVRYPDFWASMMRASVPGSGNSTAAPIELPADAPIVQSAHQQIAQALGFSASEMPTGGWCVEWHEPPYGGGWHTWNVGACREEVIRKLYRPISGLDLHICGEAYSMCQAWVEGALQSVDGLLQGMMGLPPLEELAPLPQVTAH